MIDEEGIVCATVDLFGVLSLRLNWAVQALLIEERAGQEGGPIVDLPTNGAQVPP